MPVQYCKFLAKVASYGRDDSDAPGQFSVQLEWMRLDGDSEGGKFSYSASPVKADETPDQDLRDKMKEALAAFLTEKYKPILCANTKFRRRDIVML